MTDQSTPRPWRASTCAYVWGPDVLVATCGDWHDAELLPFNRDRWEADAELIVRAVNAHDELVAALSALCDALGSGTSDSLLDEIAETCGGNVADQYQNARAALARVRGNKP